MKVLTIILLSISFAVLVTSAEDETDGQSGQRNSSLFYWGGSLLNSQLSAFEAIANGGMALVSGAVGLGSGLVSTATSVTTGLAKGLIGGVTDLKSAILDGKTNLTNQVLDTTKEVVGQVPVVGSLVNASANAIQEGASLVNLTGQTLLQAVKTVGQGKLNLVNSSVAALTGGTSALVSSGVAAGQKGITSAVQSAKEAVDRAVDALQASLNTFLYLFRSKPTDEGSKP